MFRGELEFNDLSPELKIKKIKERFFGKIDLKYIGKRDDINLFRICGAGEGWDEYGYHSLYIVYSDTGVFSNKVEEPCFEVVYIDDASNLSQCKKIRCSIYDRKPIMSFINKLNLQYPNVWHIVAEDTVYSKSAIEPQQELHLTTDTLKIESVALKILSVKEAEEGEYKYSLVTETRDICHKDFIGYKEVLNKIAIHRKNRFCKK